MDARSPLQSIFGVLGALPQGHDKPVKHALYNAVALLLLFLCCAATWALFLILEPFIKPLIWALLVGSVLHPLKRSLRYRFQRWFENLDNTNTPVVFGVLLLPINIFNDLSEFIGDQLLKYVKIIIATAITIPTILLIYNYTPNIIIGLFYKGYLCLFAIINFLLEQTTPILLLLILIGYISLVYIVWKPENNTKFHYGSIVIWLLLSGCLAHQFGHFQLPIFLFIQSIFFGGFLSEVYNIYNHLNAEGHTITFLEALSLVFHEKPIEIAEEIGDKEPNGNDNDSTIEEIENIAHDNDDDTSKSVKFKVETKKLDPWKLELFEENKKKSEQQTNTGVLITNTGIHVIQPQPELKRSLSQPQIFQSKRTSLLGRRYSIRYQSQTSIIDTDNYESTFYLYLIFWCCIIMLFWKNLFLLPLLLIPILFYCLKHIGRYFGIWTWFYNKSNSVFINLLNWFSERHDALVPVPIRGIYHIIYKINILLKTNIKDSIDTVASCVVIFGLMIFLTCASIFIVFQIYAEAIMMVQMTSNVINQTVVHNPELRQLLPPTWDDTVDSLLDNAYQYGREGISKAVKSMMVDVDAKKSEKLENQILELWDRLYQSWMTNEDDGKNGPKVTSDAVRISWESFLHDIKKSPEMFNIHGIIDFAKQNIGMLMSLLESIWSIVISNVGLVLSSFSAFISIVLGGGTAVLNFILNVIVFLTTLFYLLSSSGDLYKPVELLTNFSKSGRRFGHALEAAVNSVFTASFKMAVFYGLWTWFIHNLFNVKIVYLPSACATILGAVPFLGTYWACLPAILDLWLAQDRGIEAILFAIFQFLPISFVDTAIYKEIKGGHPYLTGLAIAGGIFCLGVEGAIIGPLLLCGLYVAIDLSSNLFKETPTEQPLNLHLQLQER